MHVNHWQDLILAVSMAAFNIALIPSVMSKHKPAVNTSLLTAVFLVPVVVVYVTLSLWYSAVMVAINCILWTTLMIQKYIQTREKTKQE